MVGVAKWLRRQVVALEIEGSNPSAHPIDFFASLLCDSYLVKAVILNQAAPIEDVALHTNDVEVPQTGPGDVLIRVKACGLCRDGSARH